MGPAMCFDRPPPPIFQSLSTAVPSRAMFNSQSIPLIAVVAPSVALAGTRMRLFSQEDPRSMWMFTEPSYTPDLISQAFHHFDLKPINIRFISERGTGKPSNYCFVDFATSADCIHAMLRVFGQKIPRVDPVKKFSVAFARNPHIPEVDFVLHVSNLPRDIDEPEFFKLFLSRYPSCRAAKLSYSDSRRVSGTVRFADYYEQQQAKDDFDGMELRKHYLRASAFEPKIRLPRSMEGNRDGEAFIDHVYQQVRQLEQAREVALGEKKMQKRMDRQARREKIVRDKLGLYGAPVPKPEERSFYEPVMLNPQRSVNEFNNYIIGCDNRLIEDLNSSRFLGGGFFIDANTMQDELTKAFTRDDSGSDDSDSEENDREHSKRTKYY